MKIALISIDKTQPDPPLALGYIASYLEKYGNFKDIIIIDKEEDIIKKIKKENPNIIAVSSVTNTFSEANELALNIKKYYRNIPIIVGGYHISLMSNHLVPSNFDIGVIGEGEQTMLELMQLYEKYGNFPKDKLKNIDGLVFRDENGNKFMTKKRDLIEPIDKIPYPKRELFKMKNYYVTLRKAMFGKFGIYLSMITSRGCPYNCIFCSQARFWSKTRFHSAEYFVGEIKSLIKKYDIDGIIIMDDLFIADKKRLKKVSELLKKERLNKKIIFHLFARANLIDEETCRYMKVMNVKVVEFGLESGSEKILKYLKGGSVTVQDNYNALKLCKKFGFKTMGSFIIGLPDETEEDLQKTMDIVKNKNLDGAHVYQITPYPSTDIWEECKKRGLVTDDITFDFKPLHMKAFNRHLTITNHISINKLEEWFYKFQEEAVKKRYENGIFTLLFSLKLKHIKYILTRRFLSKILLPHTFKENMKYLKNLKLK